MNPQQKIPATATIRPMETKDIDAVFEIYRSLVGEERAVIDADMIAADLEKTPDFSFVADAGGEVLGFLVARQTYIGEPAVGACLIQGLGVHPLFQRRGLATRLVNVLADTSRSRGIKTLRVMLNERDSRTEGFFKRMNFNRARLIVYDMVL